MSKIIFDVPALLEEDLVPATKACEYFPGKKRSRASVERYFRKGIRGTVLESVLICGKRYTSLEAIDRFIRGQLHVEAERASPKRATMSAREIEAAARRLGLPEMQGVEDFNN